MKVDAAVLEKLPLYSIISNRKILEAKNIEGENTFVKLPDGWHLCAKTNKIYQTNAFMGDQWTIVSIPFATPLDKTLELKKEQLCCGPVGLNGIYCPVCISEHDQWQIIDNCENYYSIDSYNAGENVVTSYDSCDDSFSQSLELCCNYCNNQFNPKEMTISW